MPKTFISAQQLLDDSFKLGLNIYESGYRPNYIIGVWRGGAPVGIAVQELLDFLGVESDHIAIRTSSYNRSGERQKFVRVHGLNYIVTRINADDSLLIVDDVYDTGLSINQVIEDLKDKCRKNTPEIRIATPYYKPGSNKTDYVPDFYIHETEEWLVFPHELHSLSLEEILNQKPGISTIKNQLEKLKFS
ncbi:MAG: hypoxanthine phosphoribosyltransferase [SAR324 cluster bacterium]|nr:hypoxanthine phosphoribosyltransferase [SAR324 cluster bacterium]